MHRSVYVGDPGGASKTAILMAVFFVCRCFSDGRYGQTVMIGRHVDCSRLRIVENAYVRSVQRRAAGQLARDARIDLCRMRSHLLLSANVLHVLYVLHLGMSAGLWWFRGKVFNSLKTTSRREHTMGVFI